MDDKEQEERPVSAFAELLWEQHDGGLIDELDDALRELVNAVTTYGKSGTLTLEFTFQQQGRTVVVSDTVKSKLPKPPKVQEVFFPDAEGMLHRSDPAQMSLDLRSVGTLPGDLRVVDMETGEIRGVAR